MTAPYPSMAQRIAEAATNLETERTGLKPKSVTVVQSDGTLVITMHGALSPAEQTLAKTPAGAAQVREFHRQLFASDSEVLRSAIERITGVQVREAAAEILFASGTILQAFLLESGIPADTWNGPPV